MFFASSSWLQAMPFMATSVIQEVHSDHDMIFLDTLGRRPTSGMRDPRLTFCFTKCLAKDNDTKGYMIIGLRLGADSTSI